VAHDSGSPVVRRPQDRLDDHATIDRLADELLPVLVAKLGASGLGELEVREGTWRVRLRMPADAHAAAGRRSPPGRGGARAADGPRGEHSRTDAAGTAGIDHAAAASGLASKAVAADGPPRVVAASPAVGYFRPRVDLRAGMKVRAGDPIGSVDVLGIGQDLVAPCDGLIGTTLVAAGEPVEYGQPIIVMEQPAEQPAEPWPHTTSATVAASGPASTGVTAVPAAAAATSAAAAATSAAAAPGHAGPPARGGA